MAATLLHHDLGLTWLEPTGMVRSAHALADDGEVWLVDPFDDPGALSAATELGAVKGVIQLLDRHNRDCQAIAEQLGVPHLRLPTSLPDAPLQPFEVVQRRAWKEVALWWPARRGMIVAEAIGTVPVFAVGRAAGVHPLLRLTPPRHAFKGTGRRPDHLLVGHGEPLHDGAAAALDAALAHAREDIPRLLLTLPKVIKDHRR